MMTMIVMTQYNAVACVFVSCDSNGMIEYWCPGPDAVFPKNVKFQRKTETDLYEFAKVWWISVIV